MTGKTKEGPRFFIKCGVEPGVAPVRPSGSVNAGKEGPGFFIKCGAEPGAAPARQSGSGKARNIITFGGRKWLVLNEHRRRKLLLSKDVTEMRIYNEDHHYMSSVTWETCTLRKYLNGEFLDGFTREQQQRIVATKITNPNNLWYGTPGGRKTVDKVFLLSAEEVDRYFGDTGDYLNKRRKYGAMLDDANGRIFGSHRFGSGESIFSNPYDADRAAEGEDTWRKSRGKVYWWLRSPGGENWMVAMVCAPGCVCLEGDSANYEYGVRPALWLKV